MKTKIFWSLPAQEDLESIIEYITIDSKENARALYEEIKKNCIKLEMFPETGRVPPELKAHNIESYRELIVKHWRLLYRHGNNEVNLLAVLDSRRDIDDTLLERMIKRK